MALTTATATVSNNGDGSVSLGLGQWIYPQLWLTDFQSYVNRFSQLDEVFYETAKTLIQNGINPRTATAQQVLAAVQATNYPVLNG